MSATLLVTIDTEEEFDWSGPFSPEHNTVEHARSLPRLQELFEEVGARPTYVVDYPIATTDSSAEILGSFLKRGVCEIGAHLHPWVNPPIDERISPRNSFLCNLPLSLQQQKLAVLTRAIGDAFGESPTTFKAGRYGIDFALVPTLQSLGYTVDTSVIAYTDYSAEQGPDFHRFGNSPFRLAPPLFPYNEAHPPLLEVPCTVGFTRGPVGFWSRVHRTLSHQRWRRLHPVGVLWHTGIVRKVVLSPEGTELKDQIALLKVLAKQPHAVLNVTLHSPSIEAGRTPFVRTAADLQSFLHRLRETLRFAIGEIGAQPMTFREFATARNYLPAHDRPRDLTPR